MERKTRYVFRLLFFTSRYLWGLKEKMNGIALLQKRVLLQCLICILLLSPLTSSAESVTYQYDARHRLVGATYGDGNSFSYTYDSAENRLHQSVIGTNASTTSPSIQDAGASLNVIAASTPPSQGTNANSTTPGSTPLLGFCLQSQNGYKDGTSNDWKSDSVKDAVPFHYHL